MPPAAQAACGLRRPNPAGSPTRRLASRAGPRLPQNLALSLGDNEEVCYCLKAWLELPDYVRRGDQPSRDDALRVRRPCGRAGPGGGRVSIASRKRAWLRL